MVFSWRHDRDAWMQEEKIRDLPVWCYEKCWTQSNKNKQTNKTVESVFSTSNMLPSLSAPMVHYLRMRLTWHFEVASLGCLNRKADMLVGLLEKIGDRLLFFSSLNNDHTLDLEIKRLWLKEKTLWTGTSQSTASDGARHAAEGRTHVARAALKQIEFWKKQKFFPPHHFYFWAVRFYCRFLPGPVTDMETGLNLTSV